jgi:hypothetical protein
MLTLLDYAMLKERPEHLDAYLKARRIPKAKKLTAELRALFRRARSSPG